MQLCVRQFFEKLGVDIKDLSWNLINGLNQSFQASNACWILASLQSVLKVEFKDLRLGLGLQFPLSACSKPRCIDCALPQCSGQHSNRRRSRGQGCAGPKPTLILQVPASAKAIEVGTFEELRALRRYELGRQARSRFDMASIPLDLQRRFEQRWTARFCRPDHPNVPKKRGLERQDQHLVAPDKGKRKTHRVSPAGIRSAPAL
jgi:hypothetical protein